MPQRYETINTYLNKGIIEANIEFALHQESPLCIAKLGFDVDLENGYFFKNIMHYIHAEIGFNPLLLLTDDTFLLILRDTKIHSAKTLLKKIEQGVKLQFKHEIKNIGITLLDPTDTYRTFLDRLDRYYVMSRLSTRKKMFYGTLDFDFYEAYNRNDLLATVLKKQNTATLHNLFNGIPIKEEVVIAKFEDGIAQVRINRTKVHFYNQEEFTFIQHERIPNIIKARIIKVDPLKSLLVLKNLEFLDASPVERGDIRVQPERPINATLLYKKIKLLDATILNVSESSVAIQAKLLDVEKLIHKEYVDKELEIDFQLPTDKSFLTKISAKASIFSIINETIILNIQTTVFMKSKIRQFVALRQNGLLVDLKLYLKGVI